MKQFFLFVLLLYCSHMLAQQSSKSKSKDRFREKDQAHYPVKVNNANRINREGADYAPAFFMGGIVFVSDRDKTTPSDPATGRRYAELHYAFFNMNGEPSFPQKINFGTGKVSVFSDGPVCFSRNNKVAYMTLPNNHKGVVKKSKNGRTSMKIYESHYGLPEWTPPIALPFNSDDYSCIHPSLSADGKYLFFASDMPGGQGGFDIYAVEKSNAGWGVPVNLGPVVNTDKHEKFPFISEWGALFFSSNGRSNSLGGYDIYYAENPLERPEEILNLGEPFNSDADEGGFIIDAEGKSGFFTSNQKERGYGGEDIHRFEAGKGLEGIIGKAQLSQVEIVVTDSATGQPLPQSEIRILQLSEDGFAKNDIDMYTVVLKTEQHTPHVVNLRMSRKSASDLGMADLYTNADGKGLTELISARRYLIIVSRQGYKTGEQIFVAETEDTVPLHFKLAKASPTPDAEAPIPYDNGLQVGTTIILNNIYSENNSVILYREASSYLDAIFDLLQRYPEMEMDLVAHTDTRGDARLNLELTNARAATARSYLLERGLSPSRITAYGKGETEPRNHCTEGVECSDAEHRQNNRLEARIKKIR